LDDETVKTIVRDRERRPASSPRPRARLLPDAYPGSGYVHWVGADPAHRGKRLGYLASLATLHEFVRLGCKDAVLETDDFRLPAIKVYFKLGFAPEYRHATHAPRWLRLAPQLGDRQT
jgi:mycothiol synthase